MRILIDWARFNVPPNTLLLGTGFMGQMTQPKHWKKIGSKDQASIPSGPPDHGIFSKSEYRTFFKFDCFTIL